MSLLLSSLRFFLLPLLSLQADCSISWVYQNDSHTTFFSFYISFVLLLSVTVVTLTTYQLHIVIRYRRGGWRELAKNVVFECLVMLLVAYLGIYAIVCGSDKKCAVCLSVVSCCWSMYVVDVWHVTTDSRWQRQQQLILLLIRSILYYHNLICC